MDKPSIGRIVIYKTTQQDRDTAFKNGDNGVPELPALIVNVWSDTCVNLKVISDGKADFCGKHLRCKAKMAKVSGIGQ